MENKYCPHCMNYKFLDNVDVYSEVECPQCNWKGIVYDLESEDFYQFILNRRKNNNKSLFIRERVGLAVLNPKFSKISKESSTGL